MSIAVFLGPTLSKEDALAIGTFDILPPVRQGDVYRAVLTNDYEALVIVDGFFENTASVWHKEILCALAEGIPVYGASSMGALRAAELSSFGMIGWGKIFEAYEQERYDPFEDPFNGDDEVAIVHGPEGAAHLTSLALVDLRETLARAVSSEILSLDTAEQLLERSRSVFYKSRTWDGVTTFARSLGPEGEAFADWLRDGRVSQKRLDAVSLLSHLSRNKPASPDARFRFEWTASWQRLVDEIENPKTG